MSSQLIGATTANIAEVEANTRALRGTLRPFDYGTLGIYRLSGTSLVMAAGLAANAPVFSFRWGVAAAKYALITRIALSMADDTVILAAGSSTFDLFAARSWTGSDSAGTTLTPSGNANKLRTSMATSAVSDIRISSTTTLTAGTRTVDRLALACLYLGNQNAIGAQICSKTTLFEARPGEYPLILEGNEGFLLLCNTASTGTWKFGVEVDWTEVTDISQFLDGRIP